MTREWKTRRIRVIMSTTKGKKDRIAFAATEKAKVWTSVRIRYLTVESSSPEGREVCRKRRGGEVRLEMGELGTWHKSYQRKTRGLPPPANGGSGTNYGYFFMLVKVIQRPAM